VHVADFKLSLDSSAPVPEARTHHASHEYWAVETSHKIDVRVPGQSLGRLFLLIRSDGSPRQVPPGILVMTRDREVLARLDRDGRTEPGAGFCAMTVELPAGTYVLAQEERKLGLRGQAIFVEHGWQTQVFAPWDARDAGLSRALVSMVPQDHGFRPYRSRYEYIEAALDGLASGRVVLTSDEEDELLNAKFENPMLGMIGAYAYILRDQVDYYRLSIISRNLLRLLPNSPDAQLLAILASSPRHDFALDPRLSDRLQREFDAPPMFALGCDWLIERAAEDVSLIPASSWIAQLSLVRTTGSVFTRWDMDVDPGQQLRDFREYLAGGHGDDFSSLSEIARAARVPLSVIINSVSETSESPSN
jgi:hypothetical protein